VPVPCSSSAGATGSGPSAGCFRFADCTAKDGNCFSQDSCTSIAFACRAFVPCQMPATCPYGVKLARSTVGFKFAVVNSGNGFAWQNCPGVFGCQHMVPCTAGNGVSCLALQDCRVQSLDVGTCYTMSQC
jgi:hypothetical protein